MANDVSINVVGNDQSGTQVLRNVEQQSEKTHKSLEKTAEGTDRLDTASAGLTSSLGALGSGFELVGLPNYQAALETTALGTDFLSGVGEIATVSIEHLREGVNKARTALSNWDSTTGKAVKTTAGAVAVFGALYGATKAVSAVFDTQLNPQVNELAYELQEFGKSGHTASEMSRVFGKDLESLGVGFKYLADTDNNRREFVRWGQDLLEKFVPGLDGTENSLTKTRERVLAMDEALTQLVQSGRADEAQAAFTRFAESQKEFGVSLEEVEAQFPTYTSAINEASRAGQEQTKTSEGQQVALRNLNEYIRGQIDPMYGLIDAQKTLRDAQLHLNDAVKEHGPKSREAKDAQIELAKAASNVASKANDAAGTFDGKLTPAMRTTYKAAGLTEGQINDIERRFREAKSSGDKFAKTYQANVRLNYEVIGGRFYQNGVPTYNFPAKATGGVASDWTTVNEQGQEAVRLPSGSIVYPTANARGMATQGSGGGIAHVELTFAASGDSIIDALTEGLRYRVRTNSAGDAQTYFGQTG